MLHVIALIRRYQFCFEVSDSVMMFPTYFVISSCHVFWNLAISILIKGGIYVMLWKNILSLVNAHWM